MRKDKRKKEIRLRKNFFPMLAIISTLWTAIFILIYFIDPSINGVVILFLFLLFFTLLFTFATIFSNTRRGLITATTITTFFIFRYFGIGNFLNLILIAGIAITAEIYFNNK